MFSEIKNKEVINQILMKLGQMDTKISSIDKVLKDMQKSDKTAENKTK
jgi:hypothetical protein